MNEREGLGTGCIIGILDFRCGRMSLALDNLSRAPGPLGQGARGINPQQNSSPPRVPQLNFAAICS